MAKSKVSGVAGAVRVHPLTLAELDKQEKHGKRLDTTSQQRRVNDIPPKSTTGLDLCALYDAHVEGAFVPKARTKAMHVIIQFPKALIDESDAMGLLHHAREYGKRVWGDAAIFADRYDLDEKSGGVVDLFVAPKYMKTTKLDSVGRLAVSMTNHNKLLAKKWGRKPTSVWDVGRSLQDELHEYLRDVMRLEGVKRGSKKVYAGSDWKSAEQLRVEELNDREESISSRETQLAADEKTLKNQESRVAIEIAQGKLLHRASDDSEGLELTICETGEPKMNEAVMDDGERLAYRAAWSERMLELARFVANALQALRDRIAAVVKRERAVWTREAAVKSAEQTAKQHLDAAAAAQDRVAEAKSLADAFMTAWDGIPKEQRSPPVQAAIAKARTLLGKGEAPPAAPPTAGAPKTAADGAAALAALRRGPSASNPVHLPGALRAPRQDDGASR